MPQTHFEGCKDRERMLEYKTVLKKVLFLNELMFIRTGQAKLGKLQIGKGFRNSSDLIPTEVGDKE